MEALAVSPRPEAVVEPGSALAFDHQRTLQVATDLQKFISENGLTTRFGTSEHVNIEGWQYAGQRLGLLPQIVRVEDMSSPDGAVIKYFAHAELTDLRTGNVISRAVHMCSNREHGKQRNQEFAILSMAQTRAIGKVYRQTIGWLIKAAGYEATPVEEMNYTDAQVVPTTPRQSKPSDTAARNAAAKRGAAAPDPRHADQPATAQPATAKQKADILLLLSHKAITPDEKDRMVKSINKLDTVRAKQAIQNLKRVIGERADKPRSSDADPLEAANEHSMSVERGSGPGTTAASFGDVEEMATDEQRQFMGRLIKSSKVPGEFADLVADTMDKMSRTQATATIEELKNMVEGEEASNE